MNKVKEFIKEKNLIQNGDHIIIGVSGGADSVYLLLILNELRESMNLTITAVHINHMIREKLWMIRSLCRIFVDNFRFRVKYLK